MSFTHIIDHLLAAMTRSSNSSQASEWRVELDRTWDVLGPFPIHAREQHTLTPAFPLDLAEPIDYQRSWPSSYADDGQVKWLKANGIANGDLEVSFPHIRWKEIRAVEGWAALQHHCVLRTTLTVYPPSSSSERHVHTPQLLVYLIQGSYFTLKPKSQVSDFVPQWFAGNIYDIDNTLPHTVTFPFLPSVDKPTEYDFFVSGDYEIRLFGGGDGIPVQKLNIRILLQPPSSSSVVHQKTQDVVCDFLDGYAFGDTIGVGLQSLEEWWTVAEIKLPAPVPGIEVKLFNSSNIIAPTQTRTVPLSIKQTSPFFGSSLQISVLVQSGSSSETVPITLNIVQRKSPLSSGKRSLKGTYIFAGSSPTAFLAIPPAAVIPRPYPPIVALHGAGVDIFGSTFWEDAMPSVKFSWIICPTGRTSWGLDWHGPSTEDVWLTLEALSSIIQHRDSFPHSWLLSRDTKVILLGHSNGGQGVWHVAARYPDRVLTAIPAAGYIKSQAYVPLTMSRSAHFIDPALRFILESSLTPDDNDLHVSNLSNIPILAIHGGLDENVPVWHTRELIADLKAWGPRSNVTYIEDRGGGHWYPNILDRPEVVQFIMQSLSTPKESKSPQSFTLTVANPRECGSLNGWRIHTLITPGRLSRLSVYESSVPNRFQVKQTNVHTFSIPRRDAPYDVYIDHEKLTVDQYHGDVYFSKDQTGAWKISDELLANTSQPPGRLQCILTTTGPICIIISKQSVQHELSVALRLAHIIQLYHRMDVQILTEADVMVSGSWPVGNVIFIGTPASVLAGDLLSLERTPVRLKHNIIQVGPRIFDQSEQAILFSHPHPSLGSSFIAVLVYNSVSALERAVRLFPYRTGVTFPDWAVVGEGMDNTGAAGIEAAGVWGKDWTLSDGMTWY